VTEWCSGRRCTLFPIEVRRSGQSAKGVQRQARRRGAGPPRPAGSPTTAHADDPRPVHPTAPMGWASRPRRLPVTVLAPGRLERHRLRHWWTGDRRLAIRPSGTRVCCMPCSMVTALAWVQGRQHNASGGTAASAPLRLPGDHAHRHSNGTGRAALDSGGATMARCQNRTAFGATGIVAGDGQLLRSWRRRIPVGP